MAGLAAQLPRGGHDDPVRDLTACAIVHRPLAAELERVPFVALSLGGLRSQNVSVRSVRAALRSADPVRAVHVHWPEHQLVGNARALARAAAWLGGVARLRRRGANLVYTAHNVLPHDADLSRSARRLLNRFDAMVDDVVLLSEGGATELFRERPLLRGARRHLVPHGHFRALLGDHDRNDGRSFLQLEPTQPLVVAVGQVRPYKGMLELLSVGKRLDAHVHIAGPCADPQLRERIETEVAGEARLSADLRHLSNDELSLTLAAADLVVLPYRNVFNSGTVLLALSANRPVLVPATPTFDDLADDVGAEWVHRHNGPLTADAVRAALACPPVGHAPDLSRRDWHRLAAKLRGIYDLSPIPSSTRSPR